MATSAAEHEQPHGVELHGIELLRSLRSRLAETRRLIAADEDVVKRAMAETQNRLRPMTEHVFMLNAEREAIDAELRKAACEHFLATGEAKPIAGIEVKNKTELQYPADQALEWATEKEIALIPAKLDVKTFEKIAKANHAAMPFVVQIVSPYATIAADLQAIELAEQVGK